MLARYGAGGTLDAGFGNGGRTITNLSTSVDKSEQMNSMAIQGSGRIVGAGYTGRRPALVGYVG